MLTIQTFELSIPIASASHELATTNTLPTPPRTACGSGLLKYTSPGSGFTLTPMASPSATSITTELDNTEHAFPFAKQLSYETSATVVGAIQAPGNAHTNGANCAIVGSAEAPAKRRKGSIRTTDPDLASEHALRILVAEDNAINRRLLVGCLTKMGYYGLVVEAIDGGEAIRQVELSPTPFDLILMDLWVRIDLSLIHI